LKLLIAKLRRMQFGRKSEKLERQIEQLELRLDELEATQAEKAVSSRTPAVAVSAVHILPQLKRSRMQGKSHSFFKSSREQPTLGPLFGISCLPINRVPLIANLVHRHKLVFGTLCGHVETQL